ncbi:MAG: hypothetical protein ACPG8W_11060 [Candidatus Promineifilaceae bacterium]
MFDPPHYDYIIFNKQAAFEAFRYKPPKVAAVYLSHNLHSEIDAIRDALSKGYRWVRTDGQSAIFEKTLIRPLLQDHIGSPPVHFISRVAYEN